MARGDSRSTPESNREQRPPFAMDSWSYGRRDINKLVRDLSGGKRDVAQELKNVLAKGGGKAFGLKVCEKVAGNFGYYPYKLSVPPWEIVEDIYAFQQSDRDYSRVVRSSSPLEDWIDSRSGVLRSFNFLNSHFDWTGFKYLQEARELPEVPYVAQEGVKGWGIVADIAYSPLFKKVVTKIAYGNTRSQDELRGLGGHGSFTSATTDTEASVGIWEAETGLPLVPTVNFGHESAHPDKLRYRNTFVAPLFDAIKKAGITFGVQLELVMHPDRPMDVSIVQIRPTPKKMYRALNLVHPEQKRRGLSETVFRSPIVNAVFDFTGPVQFFGFDGVDKNFEAGNFFSRGGGRPRTGEGNIGIYDERRGRQSNIKYYNAADIYYGGYLNGSEIQITQNGIRPNTWHGSEYMSVESRKLYDALDEKCGMVFLRREEIKE
ncbi:hypothetical protein HY621_01880, partial [Candidatus Uhrbacteria bacterium]|nr:hypothetical protein [Candidatus Uhrbacteria bacterium]